MPEKRKSASSMNQSSDDCIWSELIDHLESVGISSRLDEVKDLQQQNLFIGFCGDISIEVLQVLQEQQSDHAELQLETSRLHHIVSTTHKLYTLTDEESETSQENSKISHSILNNQQILEFLNQIIVNETEQTNEKDANPVDPSQMVYRFSLTVAKFFAYKTKEFTDENGESQSTSESDQNIIIPSYQLTSERPALLKADLQRAVEYLLKFPGHAFISNQALNWPSLKKRKIEIKPDIESTTTPEPIIQSQTNSNDIYSYVANSISTMYQTAHSLLFSPRNPTANREQASTEVKEQPRNG